MKSLPKNVRQADAVRIDSLRTIMQRIRTDFRITPEEGVKLIHAKMPEATDAQIENWKRTRALEVMNIDGKEMWFRKSVGNLRLLGKEFAAQNAADNHESFLTRRKYYLEAMRTPADANNVRDWRRVNITFTLDVDADAVPDGETLRVWMPFPYENLRQKNIRLESSNRPVTYSQGSKHHTVYMEAVAVKVRTLSPECKAVVENTWAYWKNDFGSFKSLDDFDKNGKKGAKILAKAVGNAEVSPIGQAFRIVRAERPDINLYHTDKHHQSVLGSYLKSCVNYLVLYGEPFGASASDCLLDPETAAYLRSVAERVVL
jgi:hypothetical protein